jgi:arylsulfatase A-like enzyme
LLIGPFADDAMTEFTEQLVAGEQLGRNPAGVPDLLALSFSGHDYVNHRFGPESIQSQDHLLRLDRDLARLFDYLDRFVGRDNLLIVMSADHGFMNAPETSSSRGFDAGRIDFKDLIAALNKACEEKFGVSRIVVQWMTGGLTLDYDAIDARHLDRETVENFVAREAEAFPGIAFAFTRSQLSRGALPATRVGLFVTRSWNRQMPIDIALVTRPFHYFMEKNMKDPTAASHGTPYAYDTNVPLLFEGARWIRPGHFTEPAEVVDVASTLAAILDIRPPSGAEGHARSEILRVTPPARRP